MNLKILTDYMMVCKVLGTDPTFEGLNKYNKLRGGK